MSARPALGRRNLWGVAFIVSMVAISALRLLHAIDAMTGFVLMAIAMLMIVPMVRAANARNLAAGCTSPAGARYARRMATTSILYMLALGSAVTLNDRMTLVGPVAILVAVLPALPIFGMIWAMGRYLAEEQDEFLRHRATVAALVGLAGVLGIGSFWGFLETFGIVSHVPGWAAVPVWAITMGLAQLWMTMRDRSGGGE